MLMMMTLIQHCGKLQGANSEGISNRSSGWPNNASLLDAGSLYGFGFVVINRGILCIGDILSIGKLMAALAIRVYGQIVLKRLSSILNITLQNLDTY